MDVKNRITSIKPSPTLAISAKVGELKTQGKDIINFAVGEPDFDTPERIKIALIRALERGETKYTPIGGIPKLREAICFKLERDNKITYRPNEVIATCGAKHAIYNALRVLLEEGDEVIIPAPYWVSYPDQVILAGGVPKIVSCTKEDAFKLSAERLEDLITPKTKILIINTPSNPTGVCYTKEELEDIAEVCAKRKIYIVSDEIYEKLVFGGFKHTSIASLSREIRELTITINGLSKSHAMTGWRFGYAAGPARIIKLMETLQGQQITNIPPFVQHACIEALLGPEDDIKEMVSEFDKRRMFLLKRIKNIEGLECVEPSGSFYVFPSVEGILGGAVKTSLQLSDRFLNDVYVATTPGEAFGLGGYIRISYATSLETIERGMDRIERSIYEIMERHK